MAKSAAPRRALPWPSRARPAEIATVTSTPRSAAPAPERTGRERRVRARKASRLQARPSPALSAATSGFPAWVRRATVPFLLVLLWQVGGAAGWWSTAVLPVPTDVAREFWILIENGQLPHHLLVSWQRVLIGAAVGISAGTVLGVAVGLWHRVDQAIDTTLQMMRTVPFLVILPLFILWFGVDELPKVLIIAIGTALPMYLNTSAGVRSVDPKLLEMGEQFGLDRPGLIRAVVLPGAMPNILTGLRYSLGISWLALVVAEQINAQEGLGFLISNAQALFQTEIIMVIVVVYALLGLATDLVVRTAEWRLLRWRHDPRKRGRAVTAVEVRGLRRAFGDHIVLDGLDLTIDDSEFVALVGRSGGGKTTLLRTLAGLDPVTEGSVEVPELRSVVFQEPRLLPWHQVWRNVTIGLPRAERRARRSPRCARSGCRITRTPGR